MYIVSFWIHPNGGLWIVNFPWAKNNDYKACLYSDHDESFFGREGIWSLTVSYSLMNAPSSLEYIRWLAMSIRWRIFNPLKFLDTKKSQPFSGPLSVTVKTMSLIIPPLGKDILIDKYLEQIYSHLLDLNPANIAKETAVRSVRIFRPSPTVTQSGQNNDQKWKIDFDVEPKWENPLMGWSSSADPCQALSLAFKSKEAAIRFAEAHGYQYYVQEPKEPKWKKKNYGDNFTYVAGKLRFCKTK